jgi:hypothetical protein
MSPKIFNTMAKFTHNIEYYDHIIIHNSKYYGTFTQVKPGTNANAQDFAQKVHGVNFRGEEEQDQKGFPVPDCIQQASWVRH